MLRIFLLTFASLGMWGAEETRLKLDVGVGAYPWGTSVDVIDKNEAAPIGQVVLNDHTVIKTYSDDLSFRFEQRKLAGVYFRKILARSVMHERSKLPEFRTEDGIFYRMSFAEAQAIFGTQLHEDTYEANADDLHRIELPHVTVTLAFVRSRLDKNSPPEHVLTSMCAQIRDGGVPLSK